MSEWDADIAIIGGGPAGAQAAWKAALLHRTGIWVDKGSKFSRIFWTPRIDNLPGQYAISGRELISSGYENLRIYEEDYGTEFVKVRQNAAIETLEIIPGGFQLTGTSKEGPISARVRNVVLATGAVDRQPALGEFRKRDIEAVLPYANKGLADYCLLCDGHTVKGKRVAVIGCDPGSRGIAKSLKKNFGADTAVVAMCNKAQTGTPNDPEASWEAVREDLNRWDIPLILGQVTNFGGIKDAKFTITFEDGSEETFDKAWISMGWYKVNNELAAQVGAQLDGNGFVVTDGDMRVQGPDGSIKGLYAVGDLRANSWKQIPVAWGEAETAVIDAFIQS